MKRGLIGAAVMSILLLILVGCGGKSTSTGSSSSGTVASPSPSASRACGLADDDTFVACGQARAEVTVAGTPITYTGGECQTGAGHVVVLVGVFPASASNTPDRFALGVGQYDQSVVFGTRTTAAPAGPAAAIDGTYSHTVIRVYHGGTRYAGTNIAVTLASNRSVGTFSGKTDDGLDVAGSFSC